MEFENNQVPEAILDKLTKVCTCRSITRKTIKEAILMGLIHFQLSKKRLEQALVPVVAKAVVRAS